MPNYKIVMIIYAHFDLLGVVPGLQKMMYIDGMKRALSKWILIELSAGLILLILFILNVI